MRIKDVVKVLEAAAPFSLQEDYDNSGLQLGDPQKEIRGILVCLDVTPEVLGEALQQDCDLIVAHHPLIFKGVKRLSGATPTEQAIIEAIRHDIGIISVHTNLDVVHNGVNHMLATKLGLKGLAVLEPRAGILKKLVTFCPSGQAALLRQALFEAGAGHIGAYDCCSYNAEGYGTFRASTHTRPFVGKKHELHEEPEVRIETIFPSYFEKQVIDALLAKHPYEEVAYDIYALQNHFSKVGAGIYGSLKNPLPAGVFLDKLKQVLGTPCLRHSAIPENMIEKVALCGGSGSFLIEKAMLAGADAFVTAEVKYNQFMDATGKLLLVDAGHYETEQFTKELLAGIIQKKLINFAVRISEAETNPVHYF